MPIGKLFTPDEAQSEFITDFIRAVDTLENISQSIDKLNDRQRISIGASRVIYHGQISSSISSPIYTVPTNTVTEVKEIVVCNPSSSDRKFTLYVVPASQTVSNSHIMYSNIIVRAEETIEAVRTLALEAGWKLYAKADANNVLNIHISGVELVTS